MKSNLRHVFVWFWSVLCRAGTVQFVLAMIFTQGGFALRWLWLVATNSTTVASEYGRQKWPAYLELGPPLSWSIGWAVFCLTVWFMYHAAAIDLEHRSKIRAFEEKPVLDATVELIRSKMRNYAKKQHSVDTFGTIHEALNWYDAVGRELRVFLSEKTCWEFESLWNLGDRQALSLQELSKKQIEIFVGNVCIWLEQRAERLEVIDLDQTYYWTEKAK